MIFQVSILLKDVNIRLPWDSLAEAITKRLNLNDIVIEKNGTFQCKFVFCGDMVKEIIQSEINESIQALISKTTEVDRKKVVVTAREFSNSDFSKLKVDTANLLVSKRWFAEARGTHFPIQEKKPEEVACETESVTYRHSSEGRENKVTMQHHRPEDAKSQPLTLSDVTEKLTSLREKLFMKVRGQRHAVYELTQGLFESEMFSKFDADRKGPATTFLFMGPSGVGKTYLAKEYGALSGRPVLVVDMSEYSDNLANLKFNGDHGQNAIVTGFVRKNPNAILIFDEIEKAHINTIHLFLQILDAGQLMDQQLHREVSFRDTTIIMTTNVGSDLYDNVETRNLSNIPRNALINALKREKKNGTVEQETVFPESITTRMANGHIIMFNHLEPYALLEIVRDEIELQTNLFKQATGIEVVFDTVNLPALIMYAGGAAADARTLRGLARNAVIKEIQDAVMKIKATPEQKLDSLRKVFLTVEIPIGENEIYKLFHQTQGMQAAIFADDVSSLISMRVQYLEFQATSDPAVFQKLVRGVTDFVVLDPFTGYQHGERFPSDVEDIHSDGMKQYEYLLEYHPEIPIYILDSGKYGSVDFGTLLSRGARGVLSVNASPKEKKELLHEFSLNALIGNSVYRLGRAGKFLSYNCAQYTIDETSVEICFANLRLKTAINGEDYGAVTQKGESSSITFDDIVGCKTAKKALAEFCAVLDDPREGILSGKKMPKGVLLYGPPGTGKTMLAKAMANCSNAMFLPISATAFFGSLVGQTESNIRTLFQKARRYAPSVIFIDEVDAIARRRTGSATTAHNEDALNTLLAEMDGFVVDEKRPIFILAATNYDIEGDGNRVLDPAFVRRFDRKIHIELPDTEARKELFSRSLARHNIDFGEAHEGTLQNVAERSAGLCNADVEMIVEMFVRDLDDGMPSKTAFLDTIDEYRFGDVKNHNDDDLRHTAYHEAGHALVSWVCGVKPLFITIISRNDYGGYLEISTEGKGTYTYSELKDMICRCLAGRAAERVVYGETAGINTGASSDLQKARYLVRACLTEYGMGDTLFSQRIGEKGEALMQEQSERARGIIADNRSALDKLVDLLMEEKCLNQEELDLFFIKNIHKG